MRKRRKSKDPSQEADHNPTITAMIRIQEQLEKRLAKAEAIGDIIKDTILSRVISVTPPKLEARESFAVTDPEAAVSIWSDLHFGEKVLPIDTVGANEYSFEEAKRRFANLVRRTYRIITMQQVLCPIDTLVICLLGDIASGECIYPGQSFRLDLNVMDQVISGGYLIADTINELSGKIANIRVECVAGNHGRTAPKGFHDPSSNWDMILYAMIKERLKGNTHVNVIVHEGTIALIDIMGRNIAISHGHKLVQSGMVETAMARAASNWPDLLRHKLQGRSLNACFFGHYHTAAMFEIGSIDVIANGSLIGGTSLSVQGNRRINEPKQWLVGIHPKRISWRYPIDVM